MVAAPLPTIRVLSTDGTLAPGDAGEQYQPYLDALTEEQLLRFYRDMAVIRRFDAEATNLQRQGELGLWVPSVGQEAAQVGSGHALRSQDHIFPAYREHAVAMIRGVDLVGILKLLRGVSHGGWDPFDPTNGNFHLYTLVIGSQTLHATGYAHGILLDGACGAGDVDRDEAVIVYFGDGATSQGDVNEAYVFAASVQTPQVFFLQNNHWAISVPVSVQSRTPLYLRAQGFGIPAAQIDGNDVLASYAVTAHALDAARSGGGPQMIEALTYRMGAHTTSDDPTKYRTRDELEEWAAKDPLARYELFLRGRGVDQAFFDGVVTEGEDFAADIRRRTLELGSLPLSRLFDNVYSEPHALVEEQRAWLERYESSFGEGS